MRKAVQQWFDEWRRKQWLRINADKNKPQQPPKPGGPASGRSAPVEAKAEPAEIIIDEDVLRRALRMGRASGDLSLEIDTLIYEALKDGATPDQINDTLRQWAKDNNIDQELIEPKLLQVTEAEYEEGRQEMVRELEQKEKRVMIKDMKKWYEEWKKKYMEPKDSKQEKTEQKKQGFYDNRPHFIPSDAAAVMLLVALGPLPYGYYQLLRWVVCGVAIFVAVSAYGWKKLWATWLFGFVAVLFNPLIPIHLSRDAWQPIDVICSILFTIAAVVLRKPSKSTCKRTVEERIILSPKTAMGPDSSLKQFPLLYLYFDDFREITKAWEQGCFEGARHDSDIRSRGFSVVQTMKDENLFLELYKNKLLRLRLNDGTELRRDVEEDYWDRAIHPEKHLEKIPFSPTLSDKTRQEISAEIKRLDNLIDVEVNAIKLRYGLG